MTLKSTKDARFKALGDKASDSAVIIEGYANKFYSDAYNERMDPMSVKLERFKQNPILLFNHDMNYPVGRVVAVEPREDGLFVKAAVSPSGHEKIAYVRELVADGTLCTFSVRFAGEQVVEDPEVAGGKLIKDWELQEVSIVSIPAQPDSTFSLAGAKSLGEARQMVLKAKGAMVAKVAAEQISKLEESGEKKEDLLEKIAEQSGSEPAALAEVLAGNVTPVPEPVLSALASVLGIEQSVLNEHNAHDVEAQKKMDSEKGKMPKEDVKEEQKADYPPLSQVVQECVSEKIPLLIKEGKPQEQAVAIAISMCSKEKGCSEFVPTTEMMTKWLEDCDKVKQAEQMDTPQDGTAVPNKEPEGMNDNAHLMLMKAQVELLGAISTKLDKLAEVMMSLQEKPEMEVEVETEAPEAPEAEQMPEAAQEQMKSILDRYEARLKALLA